MDLLIHTTLLLFLSDGSKLTTGELGRPELAALPTASQPLNQGGPRLSEGKQRAKVRNQKVEGFRGDRYPRCSGIQASVQGKPVGIF
jgi:hypothetical protein